MGAISSRLFSPSWHPSKEVEIRQGKIKGKCFEFPKGKVNAFLGIPFGKPPVGELRFQKPLPAESWSEVRDCTAFGPRCYHDELLMEKFPSVAPKDEDCLRLNVFAPDKDPSGSDHPEGYAVMVFIHGGGFAVHSAAHYGDHGICEALCLKDVIVVTIQYRLGFFGFSAGDDIPSNLGLWDQTLALQWIHDNIKAFNGNPNNVTVFGQSAGGASTDLLCLSPHSRDLFQKAIPMGGTAFCSFALNSEDHVKKVCLNVAKQMGYDEAAFKSPFDFFRSLPAHKLSIGVFGKKEYKVNQGGKLDLTPVFDGDFFPKPIEELRKEAPKKVIMTGVTEYEGLVFFGIMPKKAKAEATIEKMLETELNTHGYSEIDKAKEQLLKLYLVEKDLNNKHDAAMVAVQVLSDVLINNGSWRYADTMTNLGHTVYQYCFEYCNPHVFGWLAWFLPFKAATHGIELPYIFKKSVMTHFQPDHNDLKVLEVMTTYFTNFAKYGNPNGPNATQHWSPLSEGDTLKYLSINLETQEMKDNLHQGRCKEWITLLENNVGKNLKHVVQDDMNKEMGKNVPVPQVE